MPRPVSPPELLLRDCATAGCAVASAACTAPVSWLSSAATGLVLTSTARPGAGPAQPVCRPCGRAQRLLALLLRCQARARRAASRAALTTTVSPSASSRLSHGWSSKALPPSRPIRKA